MFADAKDNISQYVTVIFSLKQSYDDFHVHTVVSRNTCVYLYVLVDIHQINFLDHFLKYFPRGFL